MANRALNGIPRADAMSGYRYALAEIDHRHVDSGAGAGARRTCLHPENHASPVRHDSRLRRSP